MPSHENEENYGSISAVVKENEDFTMYSMPKSKKSMMGTMDINSTCDDGKVIFNLDTHINACLGCILFIYNWILHFINIVKILEIFILFSFVLNLLAH